MIISKIDLITLTRESVRFDIIFIRKFHQFTFKVIMTSAFQIGADIGFTCLLFFS